MFYVCCWHDCEVGVCASRVGYMIKSGPKLFIPIRREAVDRIEVASSAMMREYQEFLQNPQLSVMSDPESLRLMHETHVARQGSG
jgi:hypothetical protein